MSSLGIRNYFITDDDNILRIANAKLDRLFAGSKKDQLKLFSGKRVRTAEIVVELVDRRPVEVVRAAYIYLNFDTAGNLDQVRCEADRHVAMEAAFPDDWLGSSEGNVIYARQKFAERKRDHSIWWQPNSSLECQIFDVAIQMTKCRSL